MKFKIVGLVFNENYLNFYNTSEKSILYFLIINYYEQWCDHFGHFKMFYITQKLALYIKWKLIKFRTRYLQDVYHQSVVLKLLTIDLVHNWHIYILCLKSAVRNDEFQTAQETIKWLDFTFQPLAKILISYVMFKTQTAMFYQV